MTAKLTAAASETERKNGGGCEGHESETPVSSCSSQVGPPTKSCREAMPAGITSLQAPAGKGEGAGPVT